MRQAYSGAFSASEAAKEFLDNFYVTNEDFFTNDYPNPHCNVRSGTTGVSLYWLHGGEDGLWQQVCTLDDGNVPPVCLTWGIVTDQELVNHTSVWQEFAAHADNEAKDISEIFPVFGPVTRIDQAIALLDWSGLHPSLEDYFDEFWNIDGNDDFWVGFAVNSFGDNSFRTENIEYLHELIGEHSGLHVSGTQDWFRELPSKCAREAHHDAWKAMDKNAKKAYLAHEREKRMRFKNQNLNSLNGIQSSSYDTSKWLNKVEPPITEGLHAALRSYSSTSAADRFFTISPTSTGDDMQTNDKHAMWTEDGLMFDTDGNTVDFLRNYDGDAETFFSSGRIARNNLSDNDNAICPRFSAKEQSFYEKCSYDVDGGIILGGFGACEAVLYGAS